jgi:hypothetical protein
MVSQDQRWIGDRVALLVLFTSRLTMLGLNVIRFNRVPRWDFTRHFLDMRHTVWRYGPPRTRVDRDFDIPDFGDHDIEYIRPN